jgi:hypothetical protein
MQEPHIKVWTVDLRNVSLVIASTSWLGVAAMGIVDFIQQPEDNQPANW